MSVLVVPTDSAKLYYDQITQLEGVEYLLRFLWSDREGAWYLGFYDQNNNQIAVGIRLVVSWPLLRRFQNSQLPPGVLLCIDQSGAGLDVVDPTDLGTRVLLMYITSDDALITGVS